MAGGVLLCSLGLWSCGNKTPTTVNLTFKRDGTHFSGTVIRKAANSITVAGSQGDTHTYLYSELSSVTYGAPGKAAASSRSASPASGGSNSASTPSASAAEPVPADGLIHFPEGTQFLVRSSGVLDSCCIPDGALSLGVIDKDVRGPGGKVLIPEGASVTIALVDKYRADGRITMVFELGSADYGGRHFVILSAKTGPEPGARVIATGPKEGSPEAKDHGLNVHLDDLSVMAFKAETPVIFKLSE